MAVGHLIIRRYKMNIRPENFRPIYFQWFGEAADLIVGQMLCPQLEHINFIISINTTFFSLQSITMITIYNNVIHVGIRFILSAFSVHERKMLLHFQWGK